MQGDGKKPARGIYSNILFCWALRWLAESSSVSPKCKPDWLFYHVECARVSASCLLQPRNEFISGRAAGQVRKKRQKVCEHSAAPSQLFGPIEQPASIGDRQGARTAPWENRDIKESKTKYLESPGGAGQAERAFLRRTSKTHWKIKTNSAATKINQKPWELSHQISRRSAPSKLSVGGECNLFRCSVHTGVRRPHPISSLCMRQKTNSRRIERREDKKSCEHITAHYPVPQPPFGRDHGITSTEFGSINMWINCVFPISLGASSTKEMPDGNGSHTGHASTRKRKSATLRVTYWGWS